MIHSWAAEIEAPGCWLICSEFWYALPNKGREDVPLAISWKRDVLWSKMFALDIDCKQIKDCVVVGSVVEIYVEICPNSENDEHDRDPCSDVELLMGPNASSKSGRSRDHFVAFASSAPTDCLAITAGNSNEHANEDLEATNEDPDTANEDSEAYLLLSVLMNGFFADVCSYVKPCENSCLSLIVSYIQYYFPFPFSTLSDYVQLNWV